MPSYCRTEVGYRAAVSRKLVISLSLIFLAFVLTLVNLAVGVAHIGLSEVLKTLIFPNDVEPLVDTVVWTMRLPVALAAVVVGGSLGLAGAVMQTILGNPLASPYTLGVGAGAGFGASLAIVMDMGMLSFMGNVAVPVNAFFFAMVVCLSIYAMGRFGGMTTETMILSGIAMLFLFQALQASLQYCASEGDVQAIVFWTFGNLHRITWPKLAFVFSVLVLSFPVVMADSWSYTALLLGDDKAESLGISVVRLKMKAFVVVSLLAAASVCFVGTIGFVGLAGPHIGRFFSGDDQRFFFPISALCGALVMSLASLISKSIIPGSVFPIGIVTSIIGVPFFFMLVAYRQRVSR